MATIRFFINAKHQPHGAGCATEVLSLGLVSQRGRECYAQIYRGAPDANDEHPARVACAAVHGGEDSPWRTVEEARAEVLTFLCAEVKTQIRSNARRATVELWGADASDDNLLWSTLFEELGGRLPLEHAVGHAELRRVVVSAERVRAAAPPGECAGLASGGSAREGALLVRQAWLSRKRPKAPPGSKPKRARRARPQAAKTTSHNSPSPARPAARSAPTVPLSARWAQLCASLVLLRSASEGLASRALGRLAHYVKVLAARVSKLLPKTSARKRRAMLLARLRRMSRRLMRAELARTDLRCYWCAREVGVNRTDDSVATVDHLIPLKRARADVAKLAALCRRENLVVACGQCNTRRDYHAGSEPEHAASLPHCFWCGGPKKIGQAQCGGHTLRALNGQPPAPIPMSKRERRVILAKCRALGIDDLSTLVRECPGAGREFESLTKIEALCVIRHLEGLEAARREPGASDALPSHLNRAAAPPFPAEPLINLTAKI